MHIGLDCAGYVYNILESVGKNQTLEIFNNFVWADPKNRTRSHAGAFIFDSPILEEIDDYSTLRPLDIFIMRDHTHVGILAEHQSTLCLTDCSMGKGGITFSKLYFDKGSLIVEESEPWTELLKDHGVVVRRFAS